MASGPAGGEEQLPPALPVKTHRSRSSAESDCAALSPVGLQHQSDAYGDVFAEPTDCHADRCPIHRRYDPTRHQERFFSDGVPPPVPKKRLARTLSVPVTSPSPLCPWSPLSPLQRPPPQYFDNPLYMLAPTPAHASRFCQSTGEETPTGDGPVPLLSFSQLTFDTLDEHLPALFGGFDSQHAVSQGIQHRHLLFLRSLAQSVEAGVLLQGGAAERDVDTHQPLDFLLMEGKPPTRVGDGVYYSLHSPKFPERVLGLKVTEQTDNAPVKRQPPHVNVQTVVARFLPSSTCGSGSSTAPERDASPRFNTGCAATESPGGGGTEHPHLTSVQGLLQRGLWLSVERDLPQVTLEDFVQESSSTPSADPLLYDRRVCVLLLQVLMGSQHLCNTGTAVSELRPREIFLVWPGVEGAEAEDGGGLKEVEAETERRGRVQMLWRTYGSPRVVLNPQSSALSEPQPISSIKATIGALFRYCLAPRESSPPPDSDASVSTSSYRRALLHLLSRLQDGSKGPQIAEMVATLQVLLWGPHFPLFSHGGLTTTAVHNWLTIKRALLVMKLAERGLLEHQSALDWDACMCLQYLSFIDPETVASVTSQLGSL